MPGRGFFTAATLIAIALACLTVVRKLERERRLLGKLRARGAVDLHNAVPLDGLNDDDRDAAESLAVAGVLSIRRNHCHIQQTQLATFRRKRVRLALSGALGALMLAGLVAVLILRR
jgi:hypothetical protein